MYKCKECGFEMNFEAFEIQERVCIRCRKLINKVKQEKDKEIAVITSEWNDTLNEAVKKAKQEEREHHKNNLKHLLKVNNGKCKLVAIAIETFLREKHNVK